jgi:hypothetical protein
MVIAAGALAALLLTPLLGCDMPRRHSRWSRDDGSRNGEYERRLAYEERRRHEEEEQRHLDEERRQDREWSYGGRHY